MGLGAGLAALAAVAVYANSLPNGLVYDDRSVVLANPAVERPLDWRAILLGPSWAPSAELAIAYRPLTTWTFALNHALHGTDPFGYHVVNVLAHATVAALVVVLAAAVGMPVRTAGLAGVLFAVHPVHTEAVAGVVGRADVLATLFALLALYWQRRAAARGWALAPMAGSAGAVALALFAKEQTIALVGLMPLADLVLTDGGSPARFGSRLRGRRALFYLALLAAAGVYLGVRAAALGRVVGAPETIAYWMNPVARAPTTVRLLTALAVVVRALGLLVVPVHLSADYSYRQIAVAGSPFELGAAAGMAVATAAGVVAVILWRRSRAGFFWLALALLSWGVVSNLAVPIGTIFAERLLYLPSVGACGLLAAALDGPMAGPRRRFGLLAAAAVIATWSAQTGMRNPVWHDQLEFAEALVTSAPASTHAHHVLGTTYAVLGRDDAALAELDRALAIYPENVGSLYNAGIIHRRRDRPAEALACFRRITEIAPGYVPAWMNIAAVTGAEGRFDESLDAAEHAVALRPDLAIAHVARGVALHGLARPAEARAAFEEALRLDPDQPRAREGLRAIAAEP